MGLQLYHYAGSPRETGLAASPALGDPVRLVVAPGVGAGCVVPLVPQRVRVVVAGDPLVRDVGLGNPAVGPVSRLDAPPRGDDDDRLRQDDHRAARADGVVTDDIGRSAKDARGGTR